MYSILRVPENRDQFMKAYDMIYSSKYGIVYPEFDKFYAICKEIYMISNNYCYSGAGLIEYQNSIDYERSKIFVPKGPNIFELSVVLFDENDSYNKYYDLIRTIVRDNLDRSILIKSVTDESLANALRNNKFKKIKCSAEYSDTWCLNPIDFHNSSNTEYVSCDVKNDDSVIDEMTKFTTNQNVSEQEAIDRYTQDLLKKNIDEINHQLESEDKNGYYNDSQSLDEFLSNGDCCNCHCY